MKRFRILIPLLLLLFQIGVIQSQNHQEELVQDKPVTSDIGLKEIHRYKLALEKDEFAFAKKWSSPIYPTSSV